MIEVAFEMRVALDDTCDDHLELVDLKLQPEHWK
jgi:hypothetical protein